MIYTIGVLAVLAIIGCFAIIGASLQALDEWQRLRRQRNDVHRG